MADEDGGGPLHPDVAAERNQTLRLTGQVLAVTGNLLRTPDAYEADRGSPRQVAERVAGGHSVNLSDQIESLLPTPTTAAASGGNARRGGDRSNELLLPGIAEKLLPTPLTSDSKAPGTTDSRHSAQMRDAGTLMPTPNASAMNYDEDPAAWEARRKVAAAKHGNNGMGKPLGIAAQEAFIDWGEYAPAIARTEAVLGRPVPPPAIPDGRGGRMRLSPVFEEWMMLLPEGYVTDPENGLTRDEQVKAIGNMVCPPQAAYAIESILRDLGDEVLWPEPDVDLTGIVWEESRQKYRAKAKRDRRWHHIGRYDTAAEAVAARRAWLDAR